MKKAEMLWLFKEFVVNGLAFLAMWALIFLLLGSVPI